MHDCENKKTGVYENNLWPNYNLTQQITSRAHNLHGVTSQSTESSIKGNVYNSLF